MVEPSNVPSYFYIVGPTCSGKTGLAIELAKELDAMIVNCDSVQVYKSVDIGTAKPTEQEQQEVPHYLFDIVDEGEKYTVADYLKDAVDLLEDLKPPKAIFCGGSGFYVQALEKGLYPNTKPSKEMEKKVDAWIDKKGYESVYEWIKQKDPECARALSPNDHYRLRRSMQIMMSQKMTITQLKKKIAKNSASPLPPHKKIKIGLVAEKLQLRERVRQRTQEMIEAGWIEEVERLLRKDLIHWAPLQSVGYKEILMFLKDEIARDSLEERIITSTMQLIKKQMTWFKRDSEIKWFSVSEVEEAYSYAMNWMKASRS